MWKSVEVRLVALALAMAATAARADDCERFQTPLTQAMQMRANGHSDVALKIIQEQVLAKDANDLRGLYSAGLAMIDLGRREHSAKLDEGLAKLADVVSRVEAASKSASAAQLQCMKTRGVFSAANSLGAELINARRPADALVYLQKALRFDQAGLLNADTHKKMLDNLGKAYFALGDFQNARRYYTLAKKDGAPNGAAGLSLLDEIEDLRTQRVKFSAHPAVH